MRTVAVALLSLALGALGAWLLLDPREPAPARRAAGTPGTAERRGTAGPRTPPAPSGRTSLDEFVRELTPDERRELKRLLADDAPRTPVATGAGPRPGPRFVHDATATAVRAIEWDASGEAMAKLAPLLARVATLVGAGDDVPDELWGDVQLAAAPLIRDAIRLEKLGLPGEGAAGAWSHPSALANLIHATLLAAGHPLRERQEEQLDRVSRVFLAREARRWERYGPGTLRMRRILEEYRLKAEYFEAVDAILDAGQRDVLRPEAVRGLVGLDNFSAGVVFDERVDHIRYRDRDGLARKAAEEHVETLGIDDAQEVVVLAIAREWAARFPDAYLAQQPDAHQRADIEREARVAVAAEALVAFHEALLSRLALDDAQRTTLLDNDNVLVPIRRE